jgi:hypothetical protein
MKVASSNNTGHAFVLSVREHECRYENPIAYRACRICSHLVGLLCGIILKDMGMRQAFTPIADFSGINADENLYIEKVIHIGDIEVDEQGTGG